MENNSLRYILASASPRRVELLRMIIPAYTITPADILESLPHGTAPEETALHLAVKKAKAVFEQTSDSAVVIGADTVVEIEGRILGKPSGPDEAGEMLSMLSGRRHRVHTGVGIFAPGLTASFVETTHVWVSKLECTDIADYIAGGEPFDKAGSYGIQGAFCRFIPRIEGCYFNVMGLPVSRLHSRLKELKLI